MTEKQIKNEKKKAEKLKKKVASTLSWLDIDSFEEDAIVLKRDKKVSVVQGVKILPRNILIENTTAQEILINNIRNMFNRLNFTIYHQFVYSKVNMMDHYNHLYTLLEKEEDAVRKELILDDIAKAESYTANYRELSFYLMIQNDNSKEADKQLQDLINEIERTGLQYKKLLKTDFHNLAAYLFENDMIQDYYFTTGNFAILNENEIFNQEILYENI